MSDFEQERDRLIGEVSENLARCVTALNQLNRNIENTTAVGSSFEIPSRLWSQFEAVMASTAPSMEEQVLAQQREPEEALRNLPAGVAPGGGTHDYH